MGNNIPMGVSTGEYKGHKTITLKSAKACITFGANKARLIADNVEAIKKFATESLA